MKMMMKILRIMVINFLITVSGFTQQPNSDYPIGVCWSGTPYQYYSGNGPDDFTFRQLDSAGVNLLSLSYFYGDERNKSNVLSALNRAASFNKKGFVIMDSADRAAAGQRTIFQAEKERINSDAYTDSFLVHGSGFNDVTEDPDFYYDYSYRVLYANKDNPNHQRGIMLKDPRPNDEQDGKYSFHNPFRLKVRLKVPSSSGSPNDTVIHIKLSYGSSNYTWYIRKSGCQPYGQYKDTSFIFYKYSENIENTKDSISGFPNGFIPPVEANPIQIEVYWYKQVSCFLDYIMIDDDNADRLFTNRGNIQTLIKKQATYFGHHPGLGYYDIRDEPTQDMDYASGFVSKLFRDTLGPSRDYSFQAISHITNNYETYLRRTISKYMTIELYFVSSGMRNPYLPNGHRNIVPYNSVNDAYAYNWWIQYGLFDSVYKYCDKARSTAKLMGQPYSFWSIIQEHSLMVKGGGSLNGNYRYYRDPTKEELNAIIYSTLLYGSKGLIHYLYRTTSEPVSGTLRYNTGLVDSLGNHSSNYDYLIFPGDSVYTGYKQKWDQIAKINNELKILAPYINSFQETNNRSPFNSNQIPADNTLISSVQVTNHSKVYINPEDIPPIQFQTFTHSETGEKYIMAVNRGLRPYINDTTVLAYQYYDSQTVVITLKSGLFNGNSPLLAENVIKSRHSGYQDAFQIVNSAERKLILKMAPGEGAVIRLSSGLHGTISENIYLSGKVFVDDALTVNNYKKLYIEPGTEVLVDAFKPTPVTITVDKGCIKANHARFSTKDSYDPSEVPAWGGIIINDPSDSCYIQNSVIDGAHTGISLCRKPFAEPPFFPVTLSNTHFQYNNYGIKVENRIQTFIENNRLTKNQVGIYCFADANPIISKNVVVDNEYGMICASHSSPYMYNTNSDLDGLGQNKIDSNRYGVYSTMSNPLMGLFKEPLEDSLFYGLNEIGENRTAMQAEDGAVTAQANYWSGDHVIECINQIDFREAYGLIGKINYEPFLDATTNCFRHDTVTPIEVAFGEALEKELNNQYDEAQIQYEQIVSSDPSNMVSVNSVEGIKRCLTSKGEDALSYMNQMVQTYSNYDLSDYIKDMTIPFLINQGEWDQALSIVDSLIIKNTGTDIESYYLYEKAYILARQSGGTGGMNKSGSAFVKVNTLYQNIIDKHPRSTFAFLSKLDKETVQLQNALSGLPTTFVLSQNYPNPFNPNTTIKYQLPMDSKVTLKVYNALGQEVVSLVNTRQAAGYYSIQWNGKNKQNSSVSSGVYIYKLVAEFQGKTYVQSKKMLLLK